MIQANDKTMTFRMKKTLPFVCLLTLLCTTARAQYESSDRFPHYTDNSVPAPGYPVKIAKEDLVLNESNLDKYPDGIVIASNESLHKLLEFYRNDPSGKREWDINTKNVAQWVSSWNIAAGSTWSDRYVQNVQRVKQIGIVYIFTGNKIVGDFIRAHLAKIADMPIDFWVHAELRGLNPKLPLGTLETAGLNQSLAIAVAAVKPEMTPDELGAIERTWREFGLQTAVNWLDTKRSSNNWTPVISAGVLWAAKYFGDAKADSTGCDGIKFYLDNSFYEDGSYGEGPSYFTYPVGNLVNASLAMTPDQVREYFGHSNLRGSLRWRLYGYIFDTEKNGSVGVERIAFGDNLYGSRDVKGPDITSAFARTVYKDGVAAWFRRKYGCRESMESMLLHWKMGSPVVLPESPMEAGLPLMKCFENGDNYIRDGWDTGSVVFAMKTGDHASIVGHSHQHAELQSIALAAFGEMIIVPCGSASYRSRLHYEYDLTTRAANTVTIDGMNQKAPFGPYYQEGKWDDRSYWSKGKSHADVTRQETMPDGGYLICSDASEAYHIEMKEATRTVRYVPEGGFFIIKDVMAPSDGEQHHYDYRLHLYNRDDKTYVFGKGDKIKVERGAADLHIVLGSESKLTLKKRNGYMHGPVRRDYDPDGPNQGKPGSAIELDWGADGDRFVVTAVLYPVRAGQKAPKISVSKDGKVHVGGKEYVL